MTTTTTTESQQTSDVALPDATVPTAPTAAYTDTGTIGYQFADTDGADANHQQNHVVIARVDNPQPDDQPVCEEQLEQQQPQHKQQDVSVGPITAHPTDAQIQTNDSTEPLTLTLSKVPNQSSQLEPSHSSTPPTPDRSTITTTAFAYTNTNTTSTTTNTTNTTATDYPSSTSSSPILRSTSLPPPEIRGSPDSRHSHYQQLPNPSDLSSTLSLRKTSPGLAARLKALGFGASKKPTSLAIDKGIGRIDENQIREFDEKHQANSLTSVISRRGRPWKGASATFGTSFPKLRPSVSLGALRADPADSDASPLSDTFDADQPSPQLPEIITSEPLDMDTQKYRLPDHTNGNGTKVTLETRREHLERDTNPPAADEFDDPSPPPPPVPPKETPPVELAPSALSDNGFVPGLNSYFTPGHTRPGSIYTLSRASFANQLAQLTSLQLPDAESLSSQVTAIPTAQVAAKALINAAEQIRSWISKASEVIEGLNSDDDVEWSAAGGREGLAEVENAISRFEDLINAYVGAIEELQSRADIPNVPADDLRHAVTQMEGIITEWAKIRMTLQSVRGQVEIAMEWEELWNNVLGDIQGEMDELSRLVFEMEERRHKSIAAAAGGDGVDIGDLETIVEDSPSQAPRLQVVNNRLSVPVFPMSPGSPGTPTLSQDDSSLLALFARMQPLRASLDFLPMRLSVFQARAERSFPTACEELEMRRSGLDGTYKKLEKDAESLRKELGEDRWVIVFRGAGRQAQKMHESVERSLVKLRESIEGGMHLTNQPQWMKKLESYEAKKTHYGPAIERVLSIIDKGVKDRLTVNGEILRLHADLETKWNSLKEHTREMDAVIEDLQVDVKSQQLRDSVSSMLSTDRSTLGSGQETPQSSPPSSVIMSNLGLEPYTPAAKQPKPRSSSTHSSIPSGRRHSSLPAPVGSVGRKTASRLSTISGSSGATPVPDKRSSSSLGYRPRWNTSTNAQGETGHPARPTSLTPSPYSKSATSPLSASSFASSASSRFAAFRSPLARSISEAPPNRESAPSRSGHSRLSFRERLASPGPYSQQSTSRAHLSVQSSTASSTSYRRSSHQPSRSSSVATDESRLARPSSSLASTSRRSSLLPQPKPKMPTRKPEPKDSKPRWRH